MHPIVTAYAMWQRCLSIPYDGSLRWVNDVAWFHQLYVELGGGVGTHDQYSIAD